MRLSVIGWLLWLSGLVLVLAADYITRRTQDDFYAEGLPGILQNGIMFVLGVASVWLLFKGATKLRTGYRLLLVGGEVGLGYAVAVVLNLFYVCTAGIVCL